VGIGFSGTAKAKPFVPQASALSWAGGTLTGSSGDAAGTRDNTVPVTVSRLCVAFALLALAGCSSAPRHPVTTPTTPGPTTPAPVAAVGAGGIAVPSEPPGRPAPTAVPPGGYPSVTAVAAALDKAGLPCGPVKPIAHPTLSDQLASCGTDVVLGTYRSHADALNAFAVLAQADTATNAHTHMAVGANWSVNATDPTYAQKAAKALGGTYLSN
jgi:hypothetical protein